MLPKEIKTTIENFCQEYNLEFFVQYTESQDTEIDIAEYAKRKNHYTDHTVTIQLFNDQKQKCVVTATGLTKELLSQKLHDALVLFSFSPKKFSLPQLGGDRITHEAHKLSDLEQLEKDVQAHMEECIAEMQQDLDMAELRTAAFSHSASQKHFCNSAGQEASEKKTPYAGYSYVITMKKGAAIDEVYVGDIFYNFGKEEREKMREQCQEHVQTVLEPRDEVIELAGKKVLFRASATSQLINLLSSQLMCSTVKEKRSVLFDENEEAKALSKYLTLQHQTQTGTPYDSVLNGSGERRQDITAIEKGESKEIFSSLATEQKYGVQSNGIGGFATLEMQAGTAELHEEDFDYVIATIDGLHTIDERTMDLNVTCLGYVRIDGKLVFSKSLHFSANLIDILGDLLQSVDGQTKRYGSLVTPAIAVQF